MKKNLAKKITLSILAGAILLSSNVVWADIPEGTATGTGSIAIGSGANTGSYEYSVALGYQATVTEANSVALGAKSSVPGYEYSVALGYGSKADADYAVSVGRGSASAPSDAPKTRSIINVTDVADAAGIGDGDKISEVSTGIYGSYVVNLNTLNRALLELDDIYVKKDSSGTGGSGTTVDAYSKTETDDLLDAKANIVDVESTYAKKTDSYTKSEVDAKIANAATGGTVDLSAYAKQTDLTNLNDEVVKTNEELQKTNGNVSKINEELVKTNDHFNKELRNTNAQVVANAENIANIQNATTDLSQRLEKTNAKINKVGAEAAALAALHPLDYDPDDKLTFSAGMGNYAGENAAALGAFYRPNEKFMLSLGGTMGNGENMVNIGLSIGLDKASGFAKMSKRELIQEVNAVKAENEAIKADNEAMKDQLANADERIAKLEALVAQLVAK